MSIFPYGVALLDFGATVVYAYQGHYHLALVWFCYGIASAALGGIK